MSAERLILTIEDLVADGLGADEARQFGAAVEHELASLFEERGLPAGLSAAAQVATVYLGTLELPITARPEVMGRSLAGRLYDRLERPLKADCGGAP